MNRALWIVVAVCCLMVASGCEEDNERLAQFAAESTRQQAEQNREMSELNREVADAHKELVGLQHDLEEQQANVNRQRDQLESDRREIAGHRHRDPIIAAVINNVGMVLASLIPLGLAGYLLYSLNSQKDDPIVTELLIEEITSEQPMFLSPQQDRVARIEDQRKPEPPSLVHSDTSQEVDPGD